MKNKEYVRNPGDILFSLK